jgi:hypothetical protein
LFWRGFWLGDIRVYIINRHNVIFWFCLRGFKVGLALSYFLFNNFIWNTNLFSNVNNH